MPLKPKTFTLHPNEPKLTTAERGYGYRWQKYRVLYLARNPICVHCIEKAANGSCQTRVAAATDVDHIVKIQGRDDPLFWVMSNHQALCHRCHAKKTRKEMRKI